MHSLFKIQILRLFLVPMLLSSFMLGDFVNASTAYASVAGLPEAGTMVNMSSDYSLPVLKGLKINPDSPFALDFIVDANDQGKINKEEANKLISYFMAALTIDKENIWVNLSPYEQDRITDPSLAVTDLGKDLLMQDYMLKQLSASLTHPETKTGEEYWSNEYANSDLSKIWIVPGEVRVYEKGNQVFVTKMNFDVETQSEQNVSSSLVNILDEVREDVNNGENFANLRQIFHSIALAQWFKAKLQDSIFKHYINQNKVSGIELTDTDIKDKIWSQYVDSFNKGAYNTIAKVKDSYSGRIQKQKYFCGGIKSSSVVLVPTTESSAIHAIDEELDNTYMLMMKMTDEDGTYWGDKELEQEDNPAIQVTEEIIDELIYTPAQKSNAKYATENLKNDIAQVIKDNQPTLYDELISFENPLLFEVLISNVNVAFDNTNSINAFYEEVANLIDQYQTMAANNVDPARAEAAYLLLRNKDIVDANLPNSLIVRLRDNHEETMQGLMFEQNKQLVEDITVEAKKLYNASFKFQNSPDDAAAITAEMISISLQERKVLSSSIFTFFLNEKAKALNTLKNRKTNIDDFVKALKLAFDRKDMEDEARLIIAKEQPRLAEISRAIENFMLLEEIPEHAARLILENSSQDELKQWLSVKNPEFLRMLATEYPMIHKIDANLAKNTFAKALKVVDEANIGYVKAMDIVAAEVKKVIFAKIEADNITPADAKAIDVMGIELNPIQENKVKLAKKKHIALIDLNSLGFNGTDNISNFITTSTQEVEIDVKLKALSMLRKTVSADDINMEDMRNAYEIIAKGGLFTVEKYVPSSVSNEIVDYEELDSSTFMVYSSHSGGTPGEMIDMRDQMGLDPEDYKDKTKPIYGDVKTPAVVVIRELDAAEVLEIRAKEKIANQLRQSMALKEVSANDPVFDEILDTIYTNEAFMNDFNYSVLRNYIYVSLKATLVETITELWRSEDGSYDGLHEVSSSEAEPYESEQKIDIKLKLGESYSLPVDDGINWMLHSSYSLKNEVRKVVFDKEKFISDHSIFFSSPVDNEFKQLDGGIDAQGLDIKTEAMSSSIEFKAFDPATFNGFGFVITHLNKIDKKTVLASL